MERADPRKAASRNLVIARGASQARHARRVGVFHLGANSAATVGGADSSSPSAETDGEGVRKPERVNDFETGGARV